ncbi:hypothetical protein BC829DRAFT_258228 [Chytridium lagenaria]|nr:hypothetical protein BC829DRAFT_258228 [Chytridium lagenaria]
MWEEEGGSVGDDDSKPLPLPIDHESNMFEDADEDDAPVPFSPIAAAATVLARSASASVSPAASPVTSPATIALEHTAIPPSPTVSIAASPIFASATKPNPPAKPSPLVTSTNGDTDVTSSHANQNGAGEHEDEDHVPLAVVRERQSAQNSPSTPTTPASLARTMLQSPLRSSADKKPLPKLADTEAQSVARSSSSSSDWHHVSKNRYDADMPPLSVESSMMPAGWPEYQNPTPGNYDSPSESEDEYDSSDTSSDLGTVPRRTPKEPQSTFTSTYVPSTLSRQASTEDFGSSGYSSSRTVKPKTSGWFGSIYNAFQNFIDPELTEEQLYPEGVPGKPPVPTPDEDFAEGKKLFDARQYEKAVKCFELAVAGSNHVEAMKYLADCYTPARLSNSSKVSDWTKRRMTVLATLKACSSTLFSSNAPTTTVTRVNTLFSSARLLTQDTHRHARVWSFPTPRREGI